MGIFGWSYPPGCSGPPDDEAPCEVCGEWAEVCICPACPACNMHGAPACYKPAPAGHGMVATLAQQHGAALREDEYWEQGQRDRAEGEYWARHGTLGLDAESDVPQ